MSPTPLLPPINRRRMLGLSAVAVALSAVPELVTARPAPDIPAWRWHGQALGGPASMIVHDPDRRRAEQTLRHCRNEIQRLEAEFSLYRADSALRRLNRDGRLSPASLDMRRLLSWAKMYHVLTEGAFDVTVQPLWRYHASLGSHPSATAVPAALLRRTGSRHLHVEPSEIRLGRPGMAVTLNGIAQGYITDRVAELLRDAGYGAALLDLGEIRALAPRPDGSPWRIGLPGGGARPLSAGAVATSAPAGFRFRQGPGPGHLLDPKTGQGTDRYRSVTVLAASATEADALSTGFALMPADRIKHIVRQRRAAAILRKGDDDITTLGIWGS